MSSSFFIGVKGISTIRRPEEENIDVDLVNRSEASAFLGGGAAREARVMSSFHRRTLVSNLGVYACVEGSARGGASTCAS